MWNATHEEFKTSETEEYVVRIVLDGMDEVICERRVLAPHSQQVTDLTQLLR